MSTLMVMGITTALIGALPTYATAGVLSPVLLVASRVQGAALGGEAGAVLLSVEHGDQRRRGRNASFAQMGPSLGTLLATGSIAVVTLQLPEESFLAWGWRLPFFASVVLVAFGLWIRVGVQETPLFLQLERDKSQARAPVGEVLREHWRKAHHRRRRAHRSRCSVFPGRRVLAFLSHYDGRRVTHLGAGRTFDRRRMRGDDPDLLAVGPFGRRVVWNRRAVRAGARIAFPAARLPSPRQDDRLRYRCCTDRARDDVRPAGRVHRRAVSDARAPGSSLAYTLAGIVGGGIALPMFATLQKITAARRMLSALPGDRIARHRHRADDARERAGGGARLETRSPP